MRRRDFLTTVGGVAALALLPTISTTQAASGSCFLCIHSTANLDSNYNSYIDGSNGLVHKLGRNFAGIRKNYGPDNNPLISPEISYAVQHGRKVVYENGKPNPISPDTNTSGTFWRSIANGRYDAVFNRFFATIKADTRWSASNPFIYSWHHEQTSLQEPPAGKNAGTAADYIAAHRHVYGLLVSSGAHVSVGGNMWLALVPNETQIVHDSKYGSGGATTAVAPYVISKIDPGPAYYDLVGMDFYLKTTNNYKPTDWKPLHNWAMTVGKPVMTGEFGLASTKNPAAFLTGLDPILKSWGAGTGPGQVYLLACTSRVAAGGDYRWDANTTILNAWKKLANDPFYGRTI